MVSNEQRVKKVGKTVREGIKQQGIRKNRTLSLDNALFEELLNYCSKNNLVASRVIDELVRAFLSAGK